MPLIDDQGHAPQVSTIAASNPDLHARLEETVGTGIDRLRRLLDQVAIGDVSGG